MTTDPPRATRAGLSVRTRITVAVAALVGLALTGAGLVVYALESARIENAVYEQIEQELAEFRELQGGVDPDTGEPFGDVGRLIELFLTRNVPDEDEKLVGYWDGRFRSQLGVRHADVLQNQDFLRAVEDRLDTGGTEVIDTEWGDVVVTVQPVRDATTSGALVIANFLQDEHEGLNRMIRTYAIVSLLSLGLVTAVAAWQAGRLLAPVRTLRETAQEITATDLSRRIPEQGNDDITALTRTVNEMMDRLERAFTGQRQFLDDAGHELKTPLTILQGHLELVDTSDVAEVEATRLLLLDEVDRMSRLVSDLTMLAKTDRPDFLQYDRVELARFTETVLDKCRALGDRAWKLDETVHATAEIDEQRVTQAVVQLAHNAVKHTDVGDEIALGVGLAGDGTFRLWVRDTGPGVREEDKQVIFERFGRGVSKDDEGFGLGLSIVRAIAAGHGGTVTVEDAAPPGATFVLTLPLRPPVRRTEEPWHAS